MNLIVQSIIKRTSYISTIWGFIDMLLISVAKWSFYTCRKLIIYNSSPIRLIKEIHCEHE